MNGELLLNFARDPVRRANLVIRFGVLSTTDSSRGVSGVPLGSRHQDSGRERSVTPVWHCVRRILTASSWLRSGTSFIGHLSPHTLPLSTAPARLARPQEKPSIAPLKTQLLSGKLRLQ